MANGWRSLRRRILTPSMDETKLEKRGFREKNPAAREILETVGEMFLTGYGHAAEEDDIPALERCLAALPRDFQGFAYEGAAMGLAVRDGLPFSRGGRVDRLLAGEGGRHVYMVYVGIGWAMARLPRFRWPESERTDPLLRWLALDGYGFHQAYFHTRKYVHEQYRETAFPWPAEHRGYAPRAIDQGVGRAMWFVAGTDVREAVDLIERFAPERHPDLYAGLGLAATYAGGADEEELQLLRERAGEHRPQLAQGSAFAAEARLRAGLATPNTATATRVLCGMTPELAAQVTHELLPETAATDGELPAYELWRARIAEALITRGGVRR
ncbi:DUF1702 family protein [Actinomadura sp. 7K534]|uniref:DUF1702 family protein n=1 Tax=Actinomadura sp. 7K534 TaxID=2530366 RepID=UPI00104BC6CE|nr:DUF1702 family protein [Actinomadura sp. 7K534]TDB98886.1 DUF1702 family protein [Actinomadura sp. 7K534]